MQSKCEVREIAVSQVDLTILLANVMENAILASEQLNENRWISVKIGVINGSLLIQVTKLCGWSFIQRKGRER